MRPAGWQLSGGDTKLALWLLDRFGVGAIATTIATDVRRHPARALVSVLAGLMLRDAYRALWSVLWHYASLEVSRFLPVGYIPYGVAFSWTQMILAIPGWIVMGGLLSRLGGPTLVVPYVFVSAMLVAPDLWRQASNAIEDVRFRPYLYIATAREVLFTINLLIGALLFVDGCLDDPPVDRC
jgi:hypothetical protein